MITIAITYRSLSINTHDSLDDTRVVASLRMVNKNPFLTMVLAFYFSRKDKLIALSQSKCKSKAKSKLEINKE
jgi:hypothetical protein